MQPATGEDALYFVSMDISETFSASGLFDEILAFSSLHALLHLRQHHKSMDDGVYLHDMAETIHWTIECDYSSATSSNTSTTAPPTPSSVAQNGA